MREQVAMKVGMKEFASFVSAGPMAKLTLVQREAEKGEYNPAIDFWRGLREQIKKTHQNGGSAGDLLDYAAGVSDPKKVSNYGQRAAAYTKWWGKHTIEWRTGSGHKVWKAGAVEIRVNPELFVLIDDDPWAIKLNFAVKDALTADRAATMLRLMERSYRGGRSTGLPHLAVLDLARGKVHEPTPAIAHLDPVLSGEAASFQSIWDSL